MILSEYVISFKLSFIDLSELESRPPRNHVFIEGNPPSSSSPSSSLSVHIAPSFADHPLVVGPKYQPEDIRCTWGAHLGKNVSGVLGMLLRCVILLHLLIVESFSSFMPDRVVHEFLKWHSILNLVAVLQFCVEL
jgi:hypothetical protein